MPDGILSPASSILSSQASREALQMALSTVGGLQTALEAANGLAQRSVTYGMEHARAAEHVNSEVAAPSRTCTHKPELAVILAASRLHPTSSTRFCTCAPVLPVSSDQAGICFDARKDDGQQSRGP